MWIWCGFDVYIYIYIYSCIHIWYTVCKYIYIYTHCFGSFFWVWMKNKQILMSKGRTTHLSESVRLSGWFFRRVCLTSWQITILNRRYIDSNRCSSIRMLRFWSQQRRWMVQRIFLLKQVLLKIPGMNLPGCILFRLFLVACWYDYDLSWWVFSISLPLLIYQKP